MRIVATAAELRHQCDAARARSERVGLVATRGDLHDGHASLLRMAHAQCDIVVCAIVRPDGSPAVHEASDERIATDAGADLLWRPAPGPLRREARMHVVPRDTPELADVATSDMQLLGIVRPTAVYVGDGHYDHARLLRDLVTEFGLDVDVRLVETPRDADGLAVGAATRTMTPDERDAAANVPRTLDAIAASVAGGERSLFRLRARAEAHLAEAGLLLDIDDVATVDPTTYEPIDVFDRDVLLVVRAHVGDVPIVDSRLLPH